MRTIRASEIGTFLFCQRAWWFQHQDIQSDNVYELAAGNEFHNSHSRAVMLAGLLRFLALALLVGAFVLLVLHFTIQLL